MIIQKLGEKFLFHSNLDINPKQLNHFPQYYWKFSENGASTYRCRPVSHLQYLLKSFGSINTLRLIMNIYAIIV